jgi:phosphatidylinositol alpha-1,6-mannosyltransferase
VSRDIADRIDHGPPSPAHRSKRIIGLFPALCGVGGIQEAGRQTALAMVEFARRRKWESLFLSLNDSPGENLLSFGKIEIPFRGFGRAKIQFFLAAASAARDNVAMVLAAHPNLALPAALLKKLSPQLKTVVISHGIEVWEPLGYTRRAALRRADLLIAPSRYTVQKLNEIQGIPADKIRRLPWSLSPEFLRFAERPASLELPPEFPHGHVILSVGRLAASERYKGVDDLISAVAQLRPTIPDLHLVVAGDGDDLMRLQTLAGEMNINNSVHFLPGLSRGRLAACYAQAEVFALPSTGEGFGLVFLEAMAFGTPIVAVAAGGSTDLVENEINGLLVPAHNPKLLANALARLLSDDDLRATLGRRGVEKVRSQYSFAHFDSKLDEILSRLETEKAKP